MDINRLPTRVLHCSRGRQPKTWIDNIKENMNDMFMDIRVASEMSHDKEKWRMIVQRRHQHTHVYLTEEKQQQVDKITRVLSVCHLAAR